MAALECSPYCLITSWLPFWLKCLLHSTRFAHWNVSSSQLLYLITQWYIVWIKYYMRNNLIEIRSGMSSRLAPRPLPARRPRTSPQPPTPTPPKPRPPDNKYINEWIAKPLHEGSRKLPSIQKTKSKNSNFYYSLGFCDRLNYRAPKLRRLRGGFSKPL